MARKRSRPLLLGSALYLDDQPTVCDYLPQPGVPCPYHPPPVQPVEPSEDVE